MARLGGTRRTISGLVFGIITAGALVTTALAHSPGAKITSEPNPSGGFGGPFELIDHDGNPVNDKDFRGNLMVVYFGYTYCPDICPLDARNIASAMDILGDKVARVSPVFITIDPERDTPMRLAEWLGDLHPNFIGLTGTPQQIAGVTRAYRVVFERVDTAAGRDYAVNHPGLTYVMGTDGHFLFLLPPGTDPETMAAELRAVLREGN